mmetsp:Transcript_1946/g.3030  ORF Transcript_1946/g.3030 Transcript_1946/m.3030 type:complete len:313 (+) Transcript_1946:1123-2061(+)
MTAQLPCSGTLVDGHLYTHQGVFDEAWIFSGITPDQLGLNRGFYKLRRPWEPLAFVGPKQVADLKTYVMGHFKQRLAECQKGVCIDPPALRYVINSTEIDDDGEARQMPWPQPHLPFSFAKGEHLTTIVYHKPMAGGTRGQMQQHLALHSTYVPGSGKAGEDEAAEFHMVLPSDKPGWSAVDRSNMLRGLTHFGGPDSTYFRPSSIYFILLGAAASYFVCCHTALRKCIRRMADWLWSCSSPTTWSERAVRSYGDEDYAPGDLTRSFYFKHVKPKATEISAGIRGLRRRHRDRGTRTRRGKVEYELVRTAEG